MAARSISGSTFVIASNGFTYGASHALRDYLVARGAGHITFVDHPLVREGRAEHVITELAGGVERSRTVGLPNRPPLTFMFDPFVPLRIARADAWFGFNNLAALRGLARKRRGRVGRVYYWAIDFVPNRFDRGPLTFAYNQVDRLVSRSVDARIELSDAAREGRARYLGLGPGAAPALVVPIGAWFDRAPKISEDAWETRRIVFLGHLIEKNGVDVLIRAFALLAPGTPEATLDIIGGGPQEPELRTFAQSLGLQERVRFHGLVTDHELVEQLLSEGSVAAAPYVPSADNFTRYADPSKLKSYLAAGLPIVLTDVPPNARALADAGAAVLADATPEALASGLGALLSDRDRWVVAHRAALECGRSFDWNTVLGEGLERLGFTNS